MARTPQATCNFNATLSGTDWTQLNVAQGNIIATSGPTVVSGDATNTVTGSGNSSGNACARWTGAGTFTENQYASIIIPFIDPQSVENYNVGIICRASAGLSSGLYRNYLVGLSMAANDPGGTTKSVTLYKVVAQTYTQLNAAGITFSAGDELSLECEGTTAYACRNGVRLGGAWSGDISDVSAGGLPGVSGAGSANFIYGDTWEGGNLGSATIVQGESLQAQTFMSMSRGFR